LPGVGGDLGEYRVEVGVHPGEGGSGEGAGQVAVLAVGDG